MNGAAVTMPAKVSDFRIMPMDLISRGIASDMDFPIPSLYMKVWRLSKRNRSVRVMENRRDCKKCRKCGWRRGRSIIYERRICINDPVR